MLVLEFTMLYFQTNTFQLVLFECAVLITQTFLTGWLEKILFQQQTLFKGRTSAQMFKVSDCYDSRTE